MLYVFNALRCISVHYVLYWWTTLHVGTLRPILVLHCLSVPYVQYWRSTLHFGTLRPILMNYVVFRYTMSYIGDLRCTSIHYVLYIDELRCISVHYILCRWTTLHFGALLLMLVNYVAFRYTTSYIGELRCISAHYVIYWWSTFHIGALHPI